jgi:hypothetical protein
VFAAALGTVSPGLLSSLRESWEAVNNGWNQWVLNYTQSKQLDLLRNLGFSSPSWQDLSFLLIAIVVVVALAARPGRAGNAAAGPLAAPAGRVRQRLRARGRAVPPAAGPRQMAQAVTNRFGAGCARGWQTGCCGWRRNAMLAVRRPSCPPCSVN